MTTFTPKITIITPTLNVGKVIEKTLLSVAGQSYKNIQHIIIDGASSDETVSVVKKYQEKHECITLVTEPDSGIYHAMNKGLECCTGDWICFLGAEDVLYHENTLLELFTEGFFNDEHVVYGDVLIRGNAGWASDGQVYDGPFDLNKLFLKNICHQGVFYPRSVIARVGYYNPYYGVTADWDYNLHCWANYPFKYAGKIVSCFQAGGLSSKGGDQEFANDLPYNIIRYFNLDPNDRKHNNPDSQFFFPISLYWKKECHRLYEELKNQKVVLENEIHEKEKQIEALTNSYTWKTGKAILAPAQFIVKLIISNEHGHKDR